MDHYKKNFFLNEVFPGQFDTLPHILLWTLVYLADIAIVFAVSHLLEIPLPIGGAWGRIGLILYLVIAFALFCLESFLYHKITE